MSGSKRCARSARGRTRTSLAGRKVVTVAEHRHQLLPAEAQVGERLGPGRLHHGDPRREPLLGELQVLGPDAVDDRPPLAGARRRDRQHAALRRDPARPGTTPRSRFIAGEPMNSATKRFARPVVELERRADLLDPPGVHHHDLVGHRHRLDLVVGDEDRGGPEPLVQLLDLGAHLHPELGVEVRQRLVEQEHLRVAHDRAPHRHPLALAAGELARVAVELAAVRPRIAAARSTRAATSALSVRAQLQREAHVLRARSCAGRAHSSGTPWRCRARPASRLFTTRSPIRIVPGGDALEPGDHPQQRRLAAARRPDQHRELAVLDVEVDPVDHLHRAVGLPQAAHRDLRHALPSHAADRRVLVAPCLAQATAACPRCISASRSRRRGDAAEQPWSSVDSNPASSIVANAWKRGRKTRQAPARPTGRRVRAAPGRMR